MASATKDLPPKEAALFKSIVKHYETKQYKKGLKAADQVLKKFAEHGETLAMKGLILNCQEKKAEAYDLVRLGVKKDIKSHVCWHVYGLLYRSDREYLQAIKCYNNALRHDTDNVQILRDLSLLQVQMRDLAGFVQTRQHLLTLKPTNRNNWFTFAVSQHLRGQTAAAVGIVDAYERTLEGTPDNEYEHSEMLLYKNMMMREDGKLQVRRPRPHAAKCQGLRPAARALRAGPMPRPHTGSWRMCSRTRFHSPACAQGALDHLESHKDEICDVLCYLESRGELLRELGQHDEALAIYRQLIRRNPEHVGYHAGVQAGTLRVARPIEVWVGESLDAGGEKKLKELYAELQHSYPRSTVCRRLPLDFARDPAHFRVAAKTYLLPPLRKGVPSLFADIKPLYGDPAKSAALGDIFEEWLHSLETEGKLRGEKLPELPQTIMWVRVLLAQHYDITGRTNKAIEMLDTAIAHTPTLLDLYMIKARMYKHAGNVVAASQWMDHARLMDLQDRFLNTKATRYMLRADRIDDAKTTIALFTNDADGHSNLVDMQCMWYALELARSHFRLGEYGKALKSFTSVDKHFSDIVEDQFDFHTYCIRKMTLRAYVRMLRFEDSIFGHQFWKEAAHGAAQTYLAIFDKPMKAAAEAAEGGGADEMSEADRKKAEAKKRKAELKAKAAAEVEAAKAAKDKKGGGGGGGKKDAEGNKKPVDEDPDGAALAAVEDPLEKASGFLRTLQAHASKDVRTQLLACELAMRKKKYLLVLKALTQACALGHADKPEVHIARIRFLHAVSKAEGLNPTISKVIDANRAAIGAATGTALPALNASYLAKNNDGGSVLAAAEMMLLLEPAKKADALKLIAAVDITKLTLPAATAAHELVAKTFRDDAAAKALKAKALAHFPACAYFGGEAQKPVDTSMPGPNNGEPAPVS